MTVILRLRGLDVQAGAEDIREFFKRLHIPDGGVYIVGGSLREAFIAFTTERDAQLAMRYSGHLLKGSQVTLHISSMAELEHRLESLIKKKKKEKSSPTQLTVKRPQPCPDANLPFLNTSPHDQKPANPPPSATWPLDLNTANVPQSLSPNTINLQTSAVQSLDSNTAFLLGICTVLQGLQSSNQRESNEAGQRVPKADSPGVVSDVARTPELTLTSRPGYVRLFGLPASTTKEDICHFFRGLAVQEAIVNVKLGLSHVCLVKFANTQDACDALRFNQQSLGPNCVEVRGASEKMWTSALQECENAFDDGESVRPHQNPLRETADHKQKPTLALQSKKRSDNQFTFKSPKKPRLDCDSTATLSPTMEHVVMVSNLSKNMTKTEIKELFGCPNIAQKNVLHLLDKEGQRTDTAFLIFNHIEDYHYAMNLTGCHVGSNAIQVSSITKEAMRDLMAKTHPRGLKHCLTMDAKKKPNRKTKSDPFEKPEETPRVNPDSTAQTCLFLRNMPADVQKSQIKKLFFKYKLRKDNIVLLHDGDGKGIGEAVVQFKSQKLAALAQRLHGQDFLGTQVLLTSINVKQMEEILARSV